MLLCTQPMDMRKSFDGLIAATKTVLSENPLSEHLFVFVNRKAMGRKNWLFCTSEAGAEQVAAIQTILATCRAHDVGSCTCLVDVLQRINDHPASEVNELTPKRWRERFGQNSMRSDLDRYQ